MRPGNYFDKKKPSGRIFRKKTERKKMNIDWG